MTGDSNDTMLFKFRKDNEDTPESIFLSVYFALKEKGYDPINQMVGYFISGDPTYITNFKNARTSITKLERDELLSELISFYISNHNDKKL